MWVDFVVRDNWRWTFSLEEVLLLMDWSGMDYLWIIVMFLDVWTLILTAPIHCRGSIGEQVMEW